MGRRFCIAQRIDSAAAGHAPLARPAQPRPLCPPLPAPQRPRPAQRYAAQDLWHSAAPVWLVSQCWHRQLPCTASYPQRWSRQRRSALKGQAGPAPDSTPPVLAPPLACRYARGRHVAVDIAKGLNFLHSKGCVHMDSECLPAWQALLPAGAPGAGLGRCTCAGAAWSKGHLEVLVAGVGAVVGPQPDPAPQLPLPLLLQSSRPTCCSPAAERPSWR